MNTLTEIQDWFAAQCNGEWEHGYGIRIETCDNPGWWVRIDLNDTPLQEVPFETVALNISPEGHPIGTDWLHCQVDGQAWEGAGDAAKLETILEVFLKWVKNQAPKAQQS